MLVNFGDAVWWALPWSWELMQAFYNFSAVVVARARFSRTSSDPRSQPRETPSSLLVPVAR